MVLDLGEPRIGNKKFVISFEVSNFSAEFLDVPRRNVESIAYFLQMFASCQLNFPCGRSTTRNFFPPSAIAGESNQCPPPSNSSKRIPFRDPNMGPGLPCLPRILIQESASGKVISFIAFLISHLQERVGPRLHRSRRDSRLVLTATNRMQQTPKANETVTD